MAPFFHDFFARLAVMAPTIVFLSATIWLLLRKLGMTQADAPFRADDMRTWGLSFALFEAALFAAVFAAVSTALGEGELTVALSAWIAAMLTLGPLPQLVAKARK